MSAHHLAFRYDPYALFFTGLGIDIYFAVSPIPLFFLSIDRCLIMHKGYTYDQRRQRDLFMLELATLLLSISVEVIMALAELPFDEATGCGRGASQHYATVINRIIKLFSIAMQPRCVLHANTPTLIRHMAEVNVRRPKLTWQRSFPRTTDRSWKYRDSRKI